jgi:beta-glucan synthesis-associated protein KRE6
MELARYVYPAYFGILHGIDMFLEVPSMGNWGLIDLETPTSAYTRPAWTGNTDMELVFSDEFNTDGRTFYPGDDPFWEAVDLHYWVSVILFILGFL